MKCSYSKELDELVQWFKSTNDELSHGLNMPIFQERADRIIYLLGIISEGVKPNYPFYAQEIPQIAQLLFIRNYYGGISINSGAFGELFIIIKHIRAEPVELLWWVDIHPRIVLISKNLFADGYFSSAAEKAVKEVEVRLREKYVELKSAAKIPTKIGDVIGALLSENGLFRFCDTSTQSGKDYRRGVQQLFEGAIAAYRNPSAHANLNIDRKAAMEQIVLASQLMYILDKEQLTIKNNDRL